MRRLLHAEDSHAEMRARLATTENLPPPLDSLWSQVGRSLPAQTRTNAHKPRTHAHVWPAAFPDTHTHILRRIAASPSPIHARTHPASLVSWQAPRALFPSTSSTHTRSGCGGQMSAERRADQQEIGRLKVQLDQAEAALSEACLPTRVACSAGWFTMLGARAAHESPVSTLRVPLRLPWRAVCLFPVHLSARGFVAGGSAAARGGCVE